MKKWTRFVSLFLVLTVMLQTNIAYAANSGSKGTTIAKVVSASSTEETEKKSGIEILSLKAKKKEKTEDEKKDAETGEKTRDCIEDFLNEGETAEDCPILIESIAKPYMDYRKITNIFSKQWRLIHSDAIDIDADGFLVDENGFYGVAMGSYWGPIGSRYVITTDAGKMFGVIKVEAKADVDTDEELHYHSRANDIIEFVIDSETEFMQSTVNRNGYVYDGNFDKDERFEGAITQIQRVCEPDD